MEVGLVVPVQVGVAEEVAFAVGEVWHVVQAESPVVK